MGEPGIERVSHIVTLSAEAVANVEELMGRTPDGLADDLVATAQRYCAPRGGRPCEMTALQTLTPDMQTIDEDFDPASDRLVEGGKQIFAFTCQCVSGIPENTAVKFEVAMNEAQPERIKKDAVRKVSHVLTY